MTVKMKLSFTEILLESTWIGMDVLLTLKGGEQPHIGTLVLAQPRASLKNPEKLSATSSVLNLLGHKDEYVCRKVAETLASALNTNVVCTGGIHMDAISTEQIQEIEKAVEEATTLMLEKLSAA